ncbi:octanoyltransferase [Virgibacillus phasianinus]|uniref:Octanoyl-[GcvH]:protein N-octanoyltransferase n=1 Tax=Virgibacillus phasianinus TaxID=2017483 RepID=A0A220U273_9BACI|nr:lipoate--protein ligase family protein [Virgibacillus phasianinus]ASK62036.1 octanoyltransferase [Virgibacillus phasianinus]
MQSWKEIIQHPTFRYMDQSDEFVFYNEKISALTSFAIDDTLALSVGDGESAPTIRLWVHPNTVVLGIPDARLPFIEEGVELLSERGYDAVVRNSGGLAVALDEGVLNISLVLPEVKHLSIHACYEAMVSFVQYMLADLTDEIEAYEIVGSYCPGDYDLSIDGKKFAGISQRRVKEGAAIQIYLDVEGHGEERAALIRDFYKVALKDATTNFTFPDVVPETMASLSELLPQNISMDEIKRRVYQTLEELSENIMTAEFSEKEQANFIKRLEQMKKRNEKIVEMQ